MATSTSVEELSAIDQALESIQSRLKDIKQLDNDITLGDKFRRAAEEAGDLFNVGQIGAFRSSIKEAGESVAQYAKQIKEAKMSTVAMSGAFLGFIGGFGAAKATLMAFGGLIKTTFNIGRSVVGAFTKTIGTLFSFFYGALKSGGGGSGLYEQLQEMRRGFGGLEDYTNQAVFGIVDNLRQLPRRLEITGHWFTKLIENARKYAETLGPLFMDFARYQFTPATALLLHGMGATEEQQIDLVRSSRAMGESLNEMMITIARNGAAVGEAIGESAKVIQMEMLKARENIEVFGSVADEDLGVAIGRLRTLGMEAEDVANIFSTFDTFQGAAEAASQLAAGFGVQLDVFRMVNEENPTARLDMLRQSMFRAGRSAEQMSRRELMFFADSIGESDHRLVQMALSAENAGMSMADIAQAAEESGEKTKPLNEVLGDLANQIARLIHSGGGYNTFLEAMNYGIERGIRHWMWLNQLTFSYRMALRRTAWGFRNLTMVFMSTFPGILEITKGFVEILDPSRISRFFRVLTGETFDYLDGSGGGDGLVARFLNVENFDPRGFIEGFVDAILDLTGPTGPAIQRIIGGLKNIGSAVMIGFQQLLEFVSESLFNDPQDGIAARLLIGMRESLQFMVAFFTPGNVEATLMSAGNFAGGFFEGFVTPIVEFFKSPETHAVLREILELLTDAAIGVFEMSDHLFKKITGAFSQAVLGGFGTDENGLGPGLAQTLVSMMLGPTIISTIAAIGTKLGVTLVSSIMASTAGGAAASGAAASGGGLIARILGSNAAGSAVNATTRVMSGVTRVMGRAGPRLTAVAGRALSFLNPAFWALAAVDVGRGISNLGNEMRADLTEEFGSTEAETGILGASVVNTLTLGLLSDQTRQNLARGIAGMMGSFSRILKEMGLETMTNSFGNIFGAINKLLGGLWDTVAGIFTGDGDRVTAGLNSVFNGVLQALYGFAQLIFSRLIEFPAMVTSYLVSGILKVGLWLVTDGLYLLVSSIGSVFTGIVNFIGEGFQGILDWFAYPEQRDSIEQAAFDWFSGFGGGITRSWQRVKDAVNDFGERFIAFWREKLGIRSPSIIAEEIGDFFMRGLANGILSSVNAPIDAIRNATTNLIDSAKGFLGINSPSTITAGFGRDVVDGFAVGIEDRESSLMDRVRGFSILLTNGLSGVASAITSPFRRGSASITDGMSEMLMPMFETLPDILTRALAPLAEELRYTLTGMFSELSIAPELLIDISGIANTNQLSKVRSSISAVDNVVDLFSSSNGDMSKIGRANDKLDEINYEFLPRLRQFFEESGDVVRAIESSGVVKLEQSLQAGLRELLPAAVAAIETTGAEITTDNISVALGGNTFNISVILEVDGQELAKVAAENLTGNQSRS